jgi:hypothetical protein
MTDALTAEQRSKLERLVGRARRLLEEDLAAQAAGRYGIDPDGTIADEATLRLDPSGLAERREIVEVVEHLRSEGDSPPEAVARLIREAVFTHLNRLVAIRIAEALGLLPESLARGDRSRGYRDIKELAPLLAADETNGYWFYLQLCGDELAGDVPNLFDPRNPLLALAPSPAALRDLVELIADPGSSVLWTAPDCLGWAYQFFNTGEERRAMRDASAAPRNSRELAVRNQFFTPRYVVDFLVQNSLGRRLLDADPTSPLIDDLPLLVDPPTEQGEPVELADVRVLDPACGSGHFLLAAYDLLERAWQHAGVQPPDAAPHIVGSLWGIEIDPRCTQVASAAILFRARRSCPSGDLPRPNIICARSLPATATGLDEVLAQLDSTQRALINALTEALQDAPILGPLLRVEERIESEIRASIAGAASGGFAEGVEPDVIARAQDELLTDLQAVADAATATPAERMLAAEADDAVRFVIAMLQRYDAVLQNPPFGEPVPETKPYLKAAYPWIPTKDYNLLAAFVGRSLELCRPGVGYVGAITSRAGMFLKTFEAWRREILLGHHLVALADLGYGVMEQALVEAAAYVLRDVPAAPDQRATFIRLLKDTDRPAGLAAAIAAHRHGKTDDRVFQISLDDLHAVPGSPLAYWMSPAIRRLFTDHPPLEGHGAEVRQGLATGDDFRFVRLFWEVDPARIARSREETKAGKRWVPFAKGGEYSPYWADIHLVVDWENDGERIRAYDGSVIRNPQYYFRPGLTWPRRTQGGFNLRVLPAGCVFADKGSAIFASSTEDALAILGWMLTRAAQVCLESIATFGSYEVGAVQRTPRPRLDQPVVQELASGALEIATRRRGVEARADETSPGFCSPAIACCLQSSVGIEKCCREVAGQHGLVLLEGIDRYESVDRRMASTLDPDDSLPTYLNEERGFLPSEAPSAECRIPWVVDDTIEELLASGVDRGRVPELAASKAGVASAASDVVGYLFGVATGRWDLRVVGSEPPLGDLFDPVPVHPPGMLLDGGEPARSAPPGYPLGLPPGQVLFDQPGHPWDIVERMSAAADLLVDDAERLLADLVKHLKGKDLRDHLRKHFFKEHLSRYSKSRRKAPIYWPLYVPSGAWGVWLYAPSHSRETLYAVEAAATARLNAAEAEINRLRRDRQNGGGGRSARELATALEVEERLAEELRVFSREAARIAGLGWDPDLDDGIILCAAPLADLFPAWKDLASERKNIKAGKYPWATVSKWADEL